MGGGIGAGVCAVGRRSPSSTLDIAPYALTAAQRTTRTTGRFGLDGSVETRQASLRADADAASLTHLVPSVFRRRGGTEPR